MKPHHTMNLIHFTDRVCLYDSPSIQLYLEIRIVGTNFVNMNNCINNFDVNKYQIPLFQKKTQSRVPYVY